MNEEELEAKEEDFQQKTMELMINAQTQFEAMSGQTQRLAEGVRAAEKRLEQRINKAIDKEDSEEAILEEGFKPYSFTPFPKSNRGKQKAQEEGDESNSTDDVDESDEVSLILC